ncbi:MAG: CPBP family glutamic-type intramembrane protease [Planctomycetota bacterium]
MTSSPEPSAQPTPDSVEPKGLDGWIRSNPWHPRIVPFFCWIVFMTVAQFLLAPEALAPVKPFLYIAQCVATCWLLWHYRKLTPELNIRFHWLAIPTGVGLLIAWVVLGYAMCGELGWRWSQAMAGEWTQAFGVFPYEELGREPNRFGPELDAAGELVPHPIQDQYGATPALGILAMGLRLIGMALIVPLFEEMFIRSAMLRGLHKPGTTFTGLLQFASDLPVIGDWLSNTAAGQKANEQPPAFTRQLSETPVGSVTFFAIAASTLVFMASHQPRDWPGCIACGVVWCWLVWWTNKPRSGKNETWRSINGMNEDAPASDFINGRGRLGLGPVVWSHGITNALLWGYTLRWGDWRFL